MSAWCCRARPGGCSKRASTGKATKRDVRGDPEGWWRQYDDVNTRAAWIKAYAAERGIPIERTMICVPRFATSASERAMWTSTLWGGVFGSVPGSVWWYQPFGSERSQSCWIKPRSNVRSTGSG